ncbi:hypothetical protein SAMCCGM7_pA0123 (plasmid) [Sinorhizobium americanum CCGM7]|nr:hypothetical protein SAMCCGM7_pA0123 [Sinorhizobium americanum CCGM7]
MLLSGEDESRIRNVAYHLAGAVRNFAFAARLENLDRVPWTNCAKPDGSGS